MITDLKWDIKYAETFFKRMATEAIRMESKIEGHKAWQQILKHPDGKVYAFKKVDPSKEKDYAKFLKKIDKMKSEWKWYEQIHDGSQLIFFLCWEAI